MRARKHQWALSDTFACIAIAVSLLSVGVSWHIARSSRLNAKRGAIRAQALSFINFYQTMLNNYNCYATALGKVSGTSDAQKRAEDLQTSVKKSREDLTRIDTWGDAALDQFRDTLDMLPSKASGENTELASQLRAKLTPSQLMRADQVCMFGG